MAETISPDLCKCSPSRCKISRSSSEPSEVSLNMLPRNLDARSGDARLRICVAVISGALIRAVSPISLATFSASSMYVIAWSTSSACSFCIAAPLSALSKTIGSFICRIAGKAASIPAASCAGALRSSSPTSRQPSQGRDLILQDGVGLIIDAFQMQESLIVERVGYQSAV